MNLGNQLKVSGLLSAVLAQDSSGLKTGISKSNLGTAV
jgi:hypothetical protein